MRNIKIDLNVQILLLLSVTILISSKSYAKIDPPPQFAKWTSWISHGLEDLDCAHRKQSKNCQWMTTLDIFLGQQQALLKYKVRVDKKGIIPLLNDSRVSIGLVQVRSNIDTLKKPRPVIWKDGRAWVELESGQYDIEVQVQWDQKIQSLKVPHSVAIIKVHRSDGESPWVERDQEGAVWLQPRTLEKSSNQKTELETSTQVFRVWYDDIPLKLTTYIQLNISGKPRELILSHLLPKGAILTQLKSKLEADWLRDGLRIYLKPGKHTIQLESVFVQSPQKISVPSVSGGNVSPEEIWVWHRREQLRRIRLSGLEEVDPEFTALPNSLRGGTHTWIARPKEQLVIEELTRGVHRRPANTLQINRKLWLDLDGVGYTAQDHISGSLRASSRLNVLSKNVLGSARLISESDSIPLLITQDQNDDQKEGLELRVESLDLTADFRYPNLKSEIPALDWSEQMSQLSIDMYLPPGWRLFSIGGEAYSSDDWLTSWSMTHIFMVALITIGIFKIFGSVWSVVALIALILFHREANFHFEWLSLLVAYFLLSAALNSQQFIKLTTLGFTILFVPFILLVMTLVKNDFRSALHPQIETSQYINNDGYFEVESKATYRQNFTQNIYSDKMWSQSKNKSRYGERDLNQQLNLLDQGSVVQTGPGIPNWSWRTHHIYFDAPIEPGRTLSISLISPLWNRILAVIRSLGLLAFLIMLIVRLSQLKWSNLIGRSSAITVVTLIMCCSSIVTYAHAEDETIPVTIEQTEDKHSIPSPSQSATSIQSLPLSVEHSEAIPNPYTSTKNNTLCLSHQPTPSLVDQWRKRLKDDQSCHGECLYLGDMTLNVTSNTIELIAQVQAEQSSYFTLPGNIENLRWHTVRALGKDLALKRSLSRAKGEGTQLIVRVPKGIHQVRAYGNIPAAESILVPFKDIPKRLKVNLTGWVEETERNGKVSQAITLHRVKDHSTSSTQLVSNQSGRVNIDYSWFKVSKSLNLGPTWQVVTQVNRQNSSTAAELILPVIPGERVLSSDYETTERGVKVTFNEGQKSVGYFSELTPVKELNLKAPSEVKWTETWTLNCGIIWSCKTSGLNPISLGGGSQASLTWRPWPGESVKVLVSRPSSTQGAEVTVNLFKYTFEPGSQLAKGTVYIEAIASRGGSRSLKLPDQSTNINLFIDGEQQFDPAKDQMVRLPIKPGENHFKITWSLPWKREFTEQIPKLTTELKGVNFNQIYKVGHRWILWTQGPSWGPAILFWGKLFLALILALILGWKSWSPLSRLDWFLLLAGLAQHHTYTWLIVISWFIAFSIRYRWWSKMTNALLFNFGQIVLSFLTIIFLMVLFYIVERNLLSQADMQIVGARSSSTHLRWYVDLVNFSEQTPPIKVHSLPIWIWHGFMLAWSLWFASKLFQWLKWGWSAIKQGDGWRVVFSDLNLSEMEDNSGHTSSDQ